MLTLSRKTGESIVLTLPDYSEIEVYINQVDRGQVKLSLDADRFVAIVRSELLLENLLE